MRLLIALAALALAGCGPAADKSSAAAPAQNGGGPVSLASTENMPDWLLVARTADGGFVHFNQRAITRGADGTADIWVQVTYGSNQVYAFETEEKSTIIRYTLERVHYRFKCAEEQFTVAERQIMGPGEEVVARDAPREIWRAAPQRGAARIVMPIACRGG